MDNEGAEELVRTVMVVVVVGLMMVIVVVEVVVVFEAVSVKEG